MIDWETIEQALKTWFKRATELPVVWASQAQENMPRPYAELNVMSTNGLGIDENRVEYDEDQPAGGDGIGRELIYTACGNRQFVLSCKVISRDGRPSKSSKNYMEMARTSLHQHWARDLFKDANLAVCSILTSIDSLNPYQDRAENYSILDIKFNTIAEITDPKDQGTYIESTLISSDVDLWPDGIQLDDEEIPT